MLGTFLITSRETLEASLVVGIVMSYLDKTDNRNLRSSVYYGIFFGVLVSILAAIGFSFIAGGFTGRSEALFEGITMLVGAVLLTSMLVWMQKQKHALDIHTKLDSHFEKGYGRLGIILVVFLAILREGVEIVIFLHAANYASTISVVSGLMGILVAIIAGYLFFLGAKKFKLKYVFGVSTVLLVLFAGGLFAHGVHELEEASVIPVTSVFFDINHIVYEKGVFGSFLKGLFGYNGNPSVLEFSIWILYLVGMLGWFTYSTYSPRGQKA
jgi:high-affinity iron transporter